MGDLIITNKADEPAGPLNPAGAQLMGPEDVNTVDTGVTLTQMLIRITPDDAASVPDWDDDEVIEDDPTHVVVDDFAYRLKLLNTTGYTGAQLVRHVDNLIADLPEHCLVWSNNLNHTAGRGVYNGASALHTWITRHSGLMFNGTSDGITLLDRTVVRDLHQTLRMAIAHPAHAHTMFPIHKNLFRLSRAEPDAAAYNLIYEHSVRDLERALLAMTTLASPETLFAYVEAETWQKPGA